MKTDIEHASLRQEIIENGGYAISVANFVVSMTGVAIVTGFQFRNPYIVLLPLFPLYYAHLVAFNAQQTIARIAAYLRVMDEKYEQDLGKLRERIDEMERQDRRQHLPPGSWFAADTKLAESWIAPILQRMFIVLGFICVLFFALIASLVKIKPNTAPNAAPDLILDPIYNAVIFAIVLLIWLWVFFRSRRRTHPIYTRGNLTEMFEDVWRDALGKDTKKDKKSKKSSDAQA